MTPICCCGFECEFTNLHWTNTVNTFSTANPRSGARALRSNPTSATTQTDSVASIFTAGGSVSVTRFYIYFTTLPNANVWINLVISASLQSGGCYFQVSDSKLYARGGATGNGASGFTVTTGQWYRIDLRVNMSANPWTIDMQVNGTAVGSATNAVASSTVSSYRLLYAGTWSGNVDLDDFISSETSDDYPIGAGNVYHFVPTSDGTHVTAGTNDFEYSDSGTDITAASTDVWSYLDDVPMINIFTSGKGVRANAPATTEYIQVKYGPAPGVPAFSSLSSGPSSVEVIVSKNAVSTNPCNIQLRLLDNATRDDVFNLTGNNGTALSFARKHYATAPSGVAWNKNGSGNGAFDNLFIEYITSDANPDHYFNGTMIEADFPTIISRIPKPTSIGHPFMF